MTRSFALAGVLLCLGAGLLGAGLLGAEDTSGAAAPAGADDPPLRDVRSAIDRGVSFLLADQNPDGSWGTPERTKNLNNSLERQRRPGRREVRVQLDGTLKEVAGPHSALPSPRIEGVPAPEIGFVGFGFDSGRWNISSVRL